MAFGDERIGRVLGARYRLVAPVGTGASATVYLADDVQLRRQVAVKLLHPTLAEDPAFLRRFRAEAQAAAGLSHPNIVAVFDWGEDDGAAYLVTEFLGGGSLRAMLDRGRLLSPSQALVVGLETAKGLDYAHRRGLVHRDIKPANLLFGDDGRLRIADFGLARAIAEAAWTEPAGVVLGTARYASPEQAKGQPVDGRTDVYSLALTLIEAVTGQVPFAADTTVATLMNRLDKLMPVSAELGPLAPILERAGRPDPAERYDASEFGRALVQAAERLPRPAPLRLVPTLPDLATRGGDTTLAAPATATTGAPAPAPPSSPAATDVAAGAAVVAAAAAPLTAPPVGGPVAGPPPPVPVAATAANGAGALGGSADGAAGIEGASGTSAAGTTTATTSTATTPTTAATTSTATTPTATAERSVATGVLSTTATVPDAGGGAGAVVQPPPERRRRRWPFVLLAVLLVAAAAAGGLLWWRSNRTPTYAIPPNLVGLEQAKALNLIGPYGWTVTVKQERSDQYPTVGTVVRTDPATGKLERGAPFTLVVSQGPTLSPVPDVTGKTKDEAQQALDGAKLKMNVQGLKYDEQIPDGSVVSWTVGGQTVAPGTEIVKGTVVDVVLSQGPEPRTIPKVLNQPFDAANAALTKLGLQVTRLDDQFSDKVPAGAVISVDPKVGTKVPRGSNVNVVVSKGPDVVTVPATVVGADLATATTQLQAAGLTLGQVAGPATGKVVAISPAGGAVVKRGTPVNVLLG